ncbi:MAG: hypothetical protein IKR19_08780 [Acholeplasmatales bacterium]|nr:hypothetical protein [Acholeplasmatales bacterium]
MINIRNSANLALLPLKHYKQHYKYRNKSQFHYILYNERYKRIAASMSRFIFNSFQRITDNRYKAFAKDDMSINKYLDGYYESLSDIRDDDRYYNTETEDDTEFTARWYMRYSIRHSILKDKEGNHHV